MSNPRAESSGGSSEATSISRSRRSRMAFLYSVRFSRCRITEPGLGCAAAFLSIFRFQPVANAFVFRKRRARHARGRHHTGAHFADHALPNLRMVAGDRQVGFFQREVRGLDFVVMASDAVLVEHGLRCLGRRLGRLRAACWKPDSAAVAINPANSSLVFICGPRRRSDRGVALCSLRCLSWRSAWRHRR